MVPIDWNELCGRTAKTCAEMARAVGLSEHTMKEILKSSVRDGTLEKRNDPVTGEIYYSVKEKKENE